MKSLFDGTSWEIRYIETEKGLLYKVKSIKGKNGEYFEAVLLKGSEKENLFKKIKDN